MAAPLVFWIAILLPGYALLRSRAPEELEGGLLTSVAAGYIASFALLAPISLGAYLLHLPIAVMSASIVAMVVAALVVLTRTRGWSHIATLFRTELLVGLALLVIHLVMEGRIGSWLQGDATFHVGRVRHLLEHGFNNRDIYLTEAHFTRIYHTNLLHSMLAAGCQLTGVDPVRFWFGTLVWAKLVIAAAHGYLGFAVFRERWIGWLIAVLAMTTQAGVYYATYPNSLAVGWILPTLVGLCAGAAAGDDNRASVPVKLALGVFVIAQVHALYGIWLLLCLGPPLLGLGIWNAARRRSLRPVALTLAALLVVAPFVLVSRGNFLDEEQDEGATTSETERLFAQLTTLRAALDASYQTRAERRAAKRESRRLASAGGGHLDKQLETLDDGRFVLSPHSAGGWGFLLLGFGALVVCLAGLPRRRVAVAIIGTAAVCVGIILLVPAVCTLAVAAAGAPFIVVRLTPVLATLLFTLIAGAVLVATAPLRQPWLPSAAVLAAAAVGTVVPGHSPQSFAEHAGLSIKPADRRLRQLDRVLERTKLLQKYVPAGEVVLTTLPMARQVVMLYDCYVIATDRGHTNVPGIGKRRVDVLRLTLPRRRWKERQALIQQYGLRYVVFREEDAPGLKWTLRHGTLLADEAGWTIVRLHDAT